MFERFTERGRQVVVYAQAEARGIGDDFIGTEHILLGLLREDDGAARLLEKHGIELEPTRARLSHGRSGIDPRQTGQIPFTPEAKKTLEIGLREAIALGSTVVRPEHLLLGLVEVQGNAVAEILEAAGVGRESVLAWLSASPALPDWTPAPAGLRYEVVALSGLPETWVGQLDAHAATGGRLVTIVHADDSHHAVFQRRP